MSAGAVSNTAGPSGSASKDKKVKRTRKRSRNKKRTTEVEDSSSDSSSSDDSDDEEEIRPKPAPKPLKKAQSDSDSDSSSESDSDDDGKDGGDAKRKRKRKRTSKKKITEDAPKPTAAPAGTAPTTPAAKPIILSPKEVGTDPNTDLRLSDQAKQAIHYAQNYTKDKSQWKFNKAKQNWLLRNALSVPPSDYDAFLARKQSETGNAAEGSGEDAEEAEEGENFVPDDFVPVVTAYLTSVMGGARQRLVESLREAVNAPIVTLPPTQSEAVDDAAKVTPAEGSDGSAANREAANSPATSKSVSFGNLALETEQKEEAAEAAGLPAGTDPRSVELRRTRATQMLQQMGEAL